MTADPTVPSNAGIAGSGPRTGTIVVVDLVESVRLIEEDEAGTVARWQAVVAAASAWLPRLGGTLVKSLGDGMLMVFEDVPRAIESAFALHREAARAGAGVEPRRRLWLRIGVDVGEHLADTRDVYGRHVNLAARLVTLAGPGEIVVSADVRDRLTPWLDAEVDDLGECWLKHLPEPVRAYRLGPPGPEPVVEPAPSAELRPTVAVIPFVARSAEAAHAVLGEVIADDVISALARTAELDVISRLSTTALRGRRTTPSALAAMLGAGYVLSGRYAVHGRQVRVDVDLAEARGGRVVWSGALRGRLDGLVRGDDAIVDRLVAQVGAAVIAREVERAQRLPLPTLDSFTLLMSAITLMHRLSASEFDRARRMLDAVIERAPRQAEAHAWMAKWHVLRVHQGWSPDARADVAHAQACTRRALQADSRCSLALAVDGLVQTSLLGRLDAAQASYEAALGVNPNDPLANLLMGTLHAFRGEGKPAVRATQRALRLSPLDPLRYYFDSLAASAAVADDQHERAIRLAQRSLRLNRTHTSTYRALAIAQWLSGRHDEARGTVERLRALDPQLTVGGWLARSPSRDHPIGERWADALRAAGLPE